MPFHIHCHDDPAKPDLRAKLRVVHLDYMIAHKADILFGGPLKDETGRSIGSTFALRYETRAEVDAFLENEPYTQNALFSFVDIQRLAVMVPEANPGFLEAELERERALTS